ncbi:MAG: uracil-DNA glycosylase [Candidatus Brocadiia bacterium]
MAGPNCHRCRFFSVTWDRRLRYACRAFGFRSARIPSIVVRETSGHECSLFQPKDSREGDESASPP